MWKLQDVTLDVALYICFAVFMPVLFYALGISQVYFSEVKNPLFVGIILGSAALGFLTYSVFKIIKLVSLRRKLRLGIEGEMAVGQELNLLMRDGYHVFHDFPAEGFNIDHIVVGSSGVFAVETKARSKPTSKDRTADAQVIYDGKKLEFPNWTETAPLDQASRQATWLGKWLANAAGEQVQVRPVVTLPGWYVKRTASKGIPVINPKQFRSIAKPINGQILSDAQIKRIVYQLDQKCRDVEPKGNRRFRRCTRARNCKKIEY